jgi:hypothetical protein
MASSVVFNPRFVPTVDRVINDAFGYIMGAVRRIAIKSILVQTGPNAHSRPGNPVRTKRPATVYRNTIERDYDSRKQVGVCGPIKTFKNTGGLTKPAGGKTVPQMLEYGGDMIGLKPQWFLTKNVPRAFRQKKKTNKRHNLKYTVIPPGIYWVAARPTMRLAFNKTLTQQNLQAAFRRIGVSDTSSITKVI